MSDEDMSDVVFVGAHGVGKLMYSLATLCGIGPWPIICHRAPVPPPLQLFLPQGDEPVLTTSVIDFIRGEEENLELLPILDDLFSRNPEEDEISIRIWSTPPYQLRRWKFRYSSAERQERSIETIIETIDVARLIWGMLFWGVNLDRKWDITELRKKWETYNKADIEFICDKVFKIFPPLNNLPAPREEGTMAMKDVIMSVLTKLEKARIVGIVLDISSFREILPVREDEDYRKNALKCWASNIMVPFQLLWLLYHNKKIILILDKLDTYIKLSDLENFKQRIQHATGNYENPKLHFIAYFYNMGFEVLSQLLKVLENNNLISGLLSKSIRDMFAKPLQELNELRLETNEERVKEHLRNLKLAIIPIAARVKQNNEIHTIFIEDLLQLIEVMRSNT